MFEIVLATTNSGKLRELQDVASELPVNVWSLAEFNGLSEIEETGTTFPENAVLKAVGYARRLGMATIADDSGLEVDALGGRPGILSARYGGDVNYDLKIATLLAEISEAGPHAVRTARFKCAIALADANANLIACVEGNCEGTIAYAPRGTNGFGYDPVFIPDGFDKSFGELGSEIKQSISHRSRAILAIIPYLRDFIAV